MVADFPVPDTDFGLYAGISAYGGCVISAWCNMGADQDPRAITYQQNAESSP